MYGAECTLPVCEWRSLLYVCRCVGGFSPLRIGSVWWSLLAKFSSNWTKPKPVTLTLTLTTHHQTLIITTIIAVARSENNIAHTETRNNYVSDIYCHRLGLLLFPTQLPDSMMEPTMVSCQSHHSLCPHSDRVALSYDTIIYILCRCHSLILIDELHLQLRRLAPQYSPPDAAGL